MKSGGSPPLRCQPRAKTFQGYAGIDDVVQNRRSLSSRINSERSESVPIRSRICSRRPRIRSSSARLRSGSFAFFFLTFISSFVALGIFSPRQKQDPNRIQQIVPGLVHSVSFGYCRRKFFCVGNIACAIRFGNFLKDSRPSYLHGDYCKAPVYPVF